MTNSIEILIDKLNKKYNNDLNAVVFKLSDILNKPQEELLSLIKKV